MRALVIGAQPDSLGEAVARELRTFTGKPESVVTAGVKQEEVYLDLITTGDGRISGMLAQVDPQVVVCTAGINWGLPEGGDVQQWYNDHFEVNCTGPMRVLTAWRGLLTSVIRHQVRQFIVVGSNSARVPRQGSAAYCASKAALAQAVRCVARELNGGDVCGLVAYGYEPGLLAGTPMTRETEYRFPGVALTRMRGERLALGADTGALARMMVSNMTLPGAGVLALNGCMIPFDAGEV